MGFATSVVKYLVFLSNLVFALAGLALIIIGVMYKINFSEGIKALPADVGVAPTLSIIVGSIVFITAFLGCCGAVRESTCMLTTYAIVLLTIFILQIAIGVYAFLQIKDTDQLRRSIINGLENTFSHYRDNEEARESTDATQQLLRCCGVRSSTEWNFPGGQLPPSCCKNKESTCHQASAGKFDTPCGDAMANFLQGSIQIIGGVAIGIAALEIIGAVFGLCLASSIRNSYRRSYA